MSLVLVIEYINIYKLLVISGYETVNKCGF